MNFLFQQLLADPSMRKAVERLSASQGKTALYGLSGSPKSILLAASYQVRPRQIAVVVNNQEVLAQYRRDLTALLGEGMLLDLPASDIVTFSVSARSIDLASRRTEVFNALVHNKPVIVLVGVEAAVQRVPARREFEQTRLPLAVGRTLDREQFMHDLVRFGYEHVDQVDARGQFSVRGGILDLFPVNREKPVRLELFGDEVDSLREFDVVSQRSDSSLESLDVFPLTQPKQVGEWETFLDYLSPGAAVVFDEPARLREQISKLNKENPEFKQFLANWQELAEGAAPFNTILLALMLQRTPAVEPQEIISLAVKSIASYHRQLEILFEDLKGWADRETAVVILAGSREKAASIHRHLVEAGLPAILSDQPEMLVPGTILATTGELTGGFEIPGARLTVITEKDVFGRQKQRLRRKLSKDQQISYFRDIKVGDYVVHVNHGIGKYAGVETLEVAGVHKDYLLIRYAGEDKLYVPTDQVNLLQKYIGAEGETPRLSRMGGSDWNKVKSRAKAAVADMARELIQLYAERQTAPGFAFGPDTPWQKEFEEAFPFEETPDQLSAICEVKSDMERPRPMDRLLCGDVGFGKTEVAVRAAFKAVMGNKQVAVLVPTTVLAQQHYQTFLERFAGFGPTVDVISRFRSAKEQKATLEKVASGQVDVLIGTHRLLQADINFRSLGLLIVDEEQRFGVAQKEKIKRWRADVDVLTLSATPIPRTLHMSLVGARDMSIIETPPEDRYPVQTYVVEYHDAIIREALKRELKRGGQVYFVYNRIQTIEKIHEHLADMLPDARIGVAHGQMAEEALERVMLDFYEGRDDILLCTSIIENGLDVPNANTIIIYDADRFGLSQLYQMRGRVGRSHRMAYSYFTYRRDKVLSEAAEKRLQAIKEFAELGAGFKIAMRDLEIRGAGNLLGAQQHGHIVSVGFEMYCRLLEEAVHELQTGRPVELPAEPVLEFNTDAYISGDYISDPMHKIEMYQRIAAVRNEEHISDLMDELIDRFGEPNQPLINLINVARIKNEARKLGIASVLEKKSYIEIVFGPDPRVDVEQILTLKAQMPGRISIYPGPPESMHLRPGKGEKAGLEWIAALLGRLSRPTSGTDN